MKKVILCISAVLIVLASTQFLYAEVSPIIKPQFFCGYCHILTYPKIIKKAHGSWKAGKHKDVPCVDCHYSPDQSDIKVTRHKGIPRSEKDSDLKSMKDELEVLSRLITILNMDEPTVRTKPKINDKNCTTSECHPTVEGTKKGEFWTKKIEFIKYKKEDKSEGIVPYVHKTHFDKEKWVEGQEMHCTTCHQRETEKNHFEVSRQKCFLCHFKNAGFNEARAKCSLCHVVPTKPLQRQKKEGAKEDEKPITHQSIEEAKVPCQSCHLHLVRGTGMITAEKCLACHDNEKPIMKEVANKKLMHEEHVAAQTAKCFNCHEPIEHNKKADFIDTARGECTACHPDHHKYQKMLLLGQKRPGVSKMPGLMFEVKTNCLACHTEEKLKKGEKIAHGSGKTCAACHTEKHEGMAKEWKEKSDEELKNAREIEKDAMDAIENAKGKEPKDKLEKAMAMLKEGQENMRIVEYGGGVHNKKYSIMLLDAAMNNFEDAIDLLSEE